MTIKDYLRLTRPSHWFKNVFVLPGAAFASAFVRVSPHDFAIRLFLGLIATCAVASANYVINEWLDAHFDRFHPVKKLRPSVAGNARPSVILTEYIFLLVTGFGIGILISWPFVVTLVTLAIMGYLYNVRPFRTKDRPYLDVLSESVNNPIRLMLGWFCVTSCTFAPSSLLFGYWMGGAFLMAVKRYAEYRSLGSATIAGLYRRSFRFYGEESLLVSAFSYAVLAAFFLGVFLVKYRVELLLSLPFLSLLFAWYLRIGMRPQSVAQTPEHLYRERGFFLYVVFVALLVWLLLTCDLPILRWFLEKSFVMEAGGMNQAVRGLR